MSLPERQRDSAEELAKAYGKELGRYRLYFRLGTGGMASVYLGRIIGETGFTRWLAIKQIHEHLAEDPIFREMFIDEARVACKLDHPNLVMFFDAGFEEGRPFLVMEYVKGETLAQILKCCHKQGRRLPPQIAARILAWACDGLHHAHELRDPDGEPRGLVHRDLSPHNILVSYDGAVKVTDFGIAKAAGRVTKTRTGFIKGKPQYMSPEQALAKRLDRRSDVFSLGTLLWEATMGRRLFRENSEFETFRRITEGDVPRPRSIDRSYPPTLEAIVLKALSVQPAQRQQSARLLQDELEAYLIQTGKPVSTGTIADEMTSLFEDRIKTTAEMLDWAMRHPDGAPPGPARLDETQKTGSTSLSLQPPTADEPASALRAASATRPTPTWVRLAIITAVLVIAVGASALIVRLLTAAPSSTEANDATTTTVASDLIGASEPSKASFDQPPPPIPATPPDPDAGVAETAETDGDLFLFPDAADLVFAPEDADPDNEVEDDQPARRSSRRRRRWQRRRAARAAASAETGMLSIMARPWSEVLLDGRRVGRTPLMSLDVPAGRHVIHLLPRGQRPGQRRVVRVRSNSVTPVSVDFTED